MASSPMRATLQEDRQTFRESLTLINQDTGATPLATYCLSALYLFTDVRGFIRVAGQIGKIRHFVLVFYI
jgi:hypothetical protein